MARKEEILEAARDYVSSISLSSPSNVIHFEAGAKWADKNPNSRTIAEYLYKEKGYPISLNGDIPTFEEVVKHVQADAEPNLARLWHDASEVPQGPYIVLCDGLDNRQWVVEWLHIDMSYDNWQDYVERIDVSRWAYISDLLPKRGEK